MGPPDALVVDPGAMPQLAVSQQQQGERVVVTGIANADLPPMRLHVRLRLTTHAIASATLDGAVLPRLERDDGVETGVLFDANARTVSVFVPGGRAWEVEFVLGDALLPADTVDIDVEVALPPGTPSDVPIHIAGTFSGWAHVPMSWTDSTRTAARARITVPRDAWYEFKYTRGSWETVEKWPGCEEATNRYAFGSADAPRLDTVWAWADRCGE